MTRDLRSVRDRVEKLEGPTDNGSDTTIVVRETTVGSEWSGSDLEPGETETAVTEIEP